jgi:uncharacterized protein YdhG (YjbR/CyaY superfamily)
VNKIDDYLAQVREPHFTMLQNLRRELHKLLPTATEDIAWGMPTLKVNDVNIVGFAAFKNHCSLFPMSGGVFSQLAKEIEPFKTSKGTLQFTPDNLIKPALLKKMLKIRFIEESMVVRNGQTFGYYENGVIKWAGRMKGDEMHGKWSWYRKDGSLMRTGEFKAGVRVGTWATWDSSGNLVKETQIK